MLNDVRLAARTLWAARGFSAAVILTLCVGIAAATAAFSAINAVLFKPLPALDRPEELVRIRLHRPHPRYGVTLLNSTYEDYLALQRGVTRLESLSAHVTQRFSLAIGGDARVVAGALVSGDYFTVLGVRPVLGRGFVIDEDRTPMSHPVAVISHRLWQRHFGAAGSALGATISVNGVAVQIVGVAPARFAGSPRADAIFEVEGALDIWLPLAMAEIVLRDRDGRPASVRAATSQAFDFVGRRIPDTTIEQVRAQAAGVASALGAMPERAGTRADVEPVRHVVLGAGDVSTALGFALALPLIVLAIGCVNAANLLLARATRRHREWAIRVALGAPAGRLVRLVLTETVLLAVVAGAAGLLLASLAIDVAKPSVPPSLDLALDYRAFVFTALAALATAVAFGLGPALGVASRATRSGPTSARLADQAPSRLKRGLVVVQVTLSLALIATTAQLLGSIRTASAVTTIAEPDTLFTASFDLEPLRLPPEAGDRFYTRLRAQLSLSPSVAAAAVLTQDVLGSSRQGGSETVQALLPGDPKPQTIYATQVEGNVLGATRTALVHGRPFREDATDRYGVIVNRPFADKYFAGAALGRTFDIGPPGDDQSLADRFFDGDALERRPDTATRDTGRYRAVTVIGVVEGGSTRERNDWFPTIYYQEPLAYEPARVLYVRLRGGNRDAGSIVRDAVRRVDPLVPVVDIASFQERRERRLAAPLLIARITGGLGLLAGALAAAGLFSVLSFIVTTRAHEIGVRGVLGATPGATLRMVLIQGLAPVAIGSGMGAGVAVAVAIVSRSWFFGVSALDPLAVAAATVGLLAVMVVASIIPALRAARVDPMVVLKQE